MKRLFIALMLAPLAVLASGDELQLDGADIDSHDAISIQRGARVFVNYCLNCHSANLMRYNRLTELGLTEQQIKDNLLFTAEKVGEPMAVSASRKDQKQWFGVEPPDLSVIARSRGTDWLYTYLRTFYRDPKTASGWNNAVFPNVGMPHALWTLQGQRGLELITHKDGAGHASVEHKWTEISRGAHAPAQYDATVRDLVNFLVYVGEPAAVSRKAIGIVVLFVLGVLFIFAFLLKKEYWKDVK